MFAQFIRKFIAGDDLQSALENTKLERRKGIKIMLNVLGEHYSSKTDAMEDLDEYLSILERTENTEDITISVKPSQLGLDVSEDLFQKNLKKLAQEFPDKKRNILWVDMEDSETTDATLEAVSEIAEADECRVGVALQANLKRTETDLKELSGSNVAVRLVKGAYMEDEKIAYTDSDVIDEQYKKYISYLFTDFDGYFAIATHDPQMITYTEAYENMHPEMPFEFQMLRGVREQEQDKLAAKGYEIAQYTPYGPDWIPYVYRRLREGKNNIWFILRNIVNI
jgi:proline dehydrogenase